MIEHILLTVDNAAYSQPAAEFVAQLANSYRSKVTVLHAYKPAPSSAFSSYFLGFGADKASLKAKALVDRFVERLNQMGVERVKGEPMAGAPSEVLLKAAKSLKPDLIVVGSRRNTFSVQAISDQVEAPGSRGVSVPVLIV